MDIYRIIVCVIIKNLLIFIVTYRNNVVYRIEQCVSMSISVLTTVDIEHLTYNNIM